MTNQITKLLVTILKLCSTTLVITGATQGTSKENVYQELGRQSPKTRK